MDKKGFLKELEERLLILEENERKDIINDYKEKIDEKIKAGEIEKDVIEGLGDIDELAKEILSSYKINANYGNKSNAKKIIKDGENWIKNASKTMASFATDTYNNLKTKKDLSVEFVFEIIIKALMLLVVCAILKLPFILIENLVSGIFHIFEPFDLVLVFIWKILINVCYLIGCVLLFFIFFRNDFKEIDKKESPKKKKVSKETVKQEIKQEVVVEEDVQPSDKKRSGFTEFLKWIVRFFVTITIIIPSLFAVIGLVIALILSIYFVVIGIDIWGLCILLFGLCVLAGEFYRGIYTLTFKKFKMYISSLVFGCILVVTGGLFFTNNLMTFNYYDHVSSNITLATKKFDYSINEMTIIPNNATVIIDNDLIDSTIVVEVDYYNDYFDIISEKNGNTIRVRELVKYSAINNGKKMYKQIVNDLKNGEVYNYNNISRYKVVVYVNSNTSLLLNKGI